MPPRAAGGQAPTPPSQRPRGPGARGPDQPRPLDLSREFPEAVLAEARALGIQVHPTDLAGRTDCREHPVLTIDPDDAQDFDDAISLERLGADQWRLWVHVADVSHYVRPGTALDREAHRRGNSTYLVDRVVPMLPEALSNHLCSLRPGVDRLTRAVECVLSDDARVLQTRFHSAVIRSQRRLTYAEALAILERAPATPLERMLHQAHGLAQQMRRRRFEQGSLALDFPERKIRLDAQGRMLRIETVENDVSHQLIEECMLLANEAVATQLIQAGRRTLHRVHEPPDEGRLEDYRAEVLRQNVACARLSSRQEIQQLLGRLAPLAAGPVLRLGFLRALSRARYAAEPLGHYGLGKTHYTHFTSPIRRYADLVVHRALFQPGADNLQTLERTAEHLSTTESLSAAAERESKKAKVVAFLKDQLRLGLRETYRGLVTDVRPFGLFVDVGALAVSGLVPRGGAMGEGQDFDETQRQLRGRRSGRVIRAGDWVDVRVLQVSTGRNQVDFTLTVGTPTPDRGRNTAPVSGPRSPGVRRPPLRGSRAVGNTSPCRPGPGTRSA